MSLAVFVEGPSDRNPIRTLLEKLGQVVRHVGVVRQGRMLNVDAMASQIEIVAHARRRLSRVLIFRDSEGIDPEETYQRSRGPERELNQLFTRFPINYIIVDHSIEGWLAWDVDAVRRVVGGGKYLSLIRNLEANPHPANLLGRVFRANGPDFDKSTHNQVLAELADIRLIARNSPTFGRLVKILRGR
ncbi:MAG: DUF4276 family protein [Chloroflexi bacterium]|nr:DUF4276 family protein [Chloroflexota bacterium]